jgi:hypothetical protein
MARLLRTSEGEMDVAARRRRERWELETYKTLLFGEEG